MFKITKPDPVSYVLLLCHYKRTQSTSTHTQQFFQVHRKMPLQYKLLQLFIFLLQVFTSLNSLKRIQVSQNIKFSSNRYDSRFDHLNHSPAEELKLAASQSPAPDVAAVCDVAHGSASFTHSSHTHIYIYERYTESSYFPLGIKQCKVGNNFLPDKRDGRN